MHVLMEDTFYGESLKVVNGEKNLGLPNQIANKNAVIHLAQHDTLRKGKLPHLGSMSQIPNQTGWLVWFATIHRNNTHQP